MAGPSAPAYAAAEFNAYAKKVSSALARGGELATKGEFDAALAVLDETLATIRPRSLQATLWLSRANYHQAQGRVSAANEDLAAAEHLLAGIDEKTRRAERCGQLACYLACQRAMLYVDWGLVDLANMQVSRAQWFIPPRTAADENYDRERIFANQIEARVLLTMEDYVGLERLVTEALQGEVYAKFPGEGARLLTRLGSGLKESGRTKPEDAERARVTLEEALANPELSGLDRVLPELDLAELALRRSDWEAAEKGIAAAAEAMGPLEGRAALPMHVTWSALSARLMFERNDRATTRESLEAMREGLARTLGLLVGEWGHRELRPGGYGPLQYADHQALVSELMRLDMRLDEGSAGIERALARLLAVEGTSTLARKLVAPAVSLTEVRETLLAPIPGHVLLVYFPAPNRTHLFIVRRDSVEYVPLPAADLVEIARFEAERTLRRALPDSGAEWKQGERTQALAQLQESLLPPGVCARLREFPRWTIVGEDLLGPVPFEALMLDGAYLGRTCAIARLPSLAVGVRLAGRAREPLRSAGPAAPSVLLLSPSLELATPLSEAEVTDMVAAYPSSSRHIALGPQAGVDTLKRTLSSVRVLQILAHGRHDPLRERPAGMLLGNADGGETFFGAEEVAHLDTPPLVLLTVCGAGRAPKRRGDAGAADLAGAFLAAGERARSVVQSAYDLDVESARQISILFHAALLRGDAPAEAMRKARAELARDKDFADPFHHASMVVVGLGHEALFAP
ncbi:MAG: CHAT domain-containing protein [Planctomycetes bacterium]|nr:CHAT domain-containing protein [Planctomycetota bacterium]